MLSARLTREIHDKRDPAAVPPPRPAFSQHRVRLLDGAPDFFYFDRDGQLQPTNGPGEYTIDGEAFDRRRNHPRIESL